MQLVILAAGHGTRFGGLKQLAPVGPDGESIMDYTVTEAEACGFAGAVVVVREEIRAEVAEHVRRRWPSSLPATFVCQPPAPPGTARAVLAARPEIDGPFAVANADDLYGYQALDALVCHFTPGREQAAAEGDGGHGSAARAKRAAEAAAGGPQVGADGSKRPAGDSNRASSMAVADRHLLIGYRLEHTVLTDAVVKRGVCEVDGGGLLDRIVEHRVQRHEDGSFEGRPLPNAVHAEETEASVRRLRGHELVSMNLWGFHQRMLGHLAGAVERFDPAAAGRSELLLPDVVGDLVENRTDFVQVVGTEARCLGVTHREDIDVVRAELALGTTDDARAPG